MGTQTFYILQLAEGIGLNVSVHAFYSLNSRFVVMAGPGVVTESLHDGRWYQCSDGWPIEPLDALHLIFPNKGRNSTGRNVCFVPRLIEFPLLRNLLPDSTELFVPDHLVDSCVVLFVLCTLVTVGLILTKFIWERVDSKFASITPSHKKWYVVANMSKAFFLACMALSSRYWIGAYLGFFLDEFQTVELKRCGMLYIATDIVALYMVPKLPLSTVLHHVSTTVLIMLVSSMDISVKGWGGLLGVCKMSLIYGVLSSFAFLVNAYLGLRVVYPKAKWMHWFVKISLYPYVLCCAINWTTHAVWLAGIISSFDLSIYNLLYLIAISFMVHDDIVLTRWLIKRSSPMAANGEGTITTKKEQ